MLAWFVLNQTRWNNISDHSVYYTDYEIQDRYALAVFFHSTGGETWNNKSGWLSSDSICAWAGITCNMSSGRPELIRLKQNGLKGSIPEEISSIDTIILFQVFQNNLEGEIPSSIYSLPNIAALDFKENRFVDELFPPELFFASGSLQFYRATAGCTSKIPTVEILRIVVHFGFLWWIR